MDLSLIQFERPRMSILRLSFDFARPCVALRGHNFQFQVSDFWSETGDWMGREVQGGIHTALFRFIPVYSASQQESFFGNGGEATKGT